MKAKHKPLSSGVPEAFDPTPRGNRWTGGARYADGCPAIVTPIAPEEKDAVQRAALREGCTVAEFTRRALRARVTGIMHLVAIDTEGA